MLLRRMFKKSNKNDTAGKGILLTTPASCEQRRSHCSPRTCSISVATTLHGGVSNLRLKDAQDLSRIAPFYRTFEHALIGNELKTIFDSVFLMMPTYFL